MDHVIVIHPDGAVSRLHRDDSVQQIGRQRCERASHVEWSTDRQCWDVIPCGPFAHLQPITGFDRRDDAIKAEIALLQEYLWNDPETIQEFADACKF